MTRAQAGAARRLLIAGALLCLPASVPADRLVLRDGLTIETRGAVKLDSRRAVYTDLSGHLVALRIEEVDVARTTAPPTPPAPKATGRTPAAAPAAAAAKPRPPVLRLTDADVGHLEDSPGGTDAADVAPARVVTLYSTSWCGWCRKSRELMQSLGIAYIEKDVERDPRAAAEKDRLAPGAGVPVLVHGDEIQTGFNEATIRSWALAGKS